MFGRTRKVEFLDLKPVTDKLLEELAQHDPHSQEFSKAMKHLKKIVDLQSKGKKTIDLNTVILVAGNLLGVLVIVAYEQNHIMNTKGLGFVRKP